MMRIKYNPPRQLITLILVVVFIVGISADGCKKGCPRSDNGKLKYSPGFAYHYNFDSVVSIRVQNAQNEETGIKLNGDATLFYEGDCTYSFKLDKVEVQTTLDKLQKEMRSDFDKAIRFTMIDGELEPQICADQMDNEYSLNIKRGIVSMFQMSESKYETDVFGLCPTETTTSMNGGEKIVTKIRNLNKCSYRENIIAFYATGIVNENSGIKSRPTLNGEYVQVQHMNNGIIQEVDVSESYNSPQQVKQKSVVWVNVKSKLKFTQQAGAAAPKIQKPQSKSIVFHHPNNKAVQNLEILRKVFEETVNLLTEYAKADSAQHFSELIRLMRNADVNTLLELSSARSDLAKKVYFDALVRSGTPESVKAIVKQISKWSEKEQKIALMSLAFVSSIDLESLNSVADLLTPNAGREAYLPIGILVNTYCRENSCDHGEVDVITEKFSRALRNCKAQTKADEDNIVSVLKGIRNVQHIANSITKQLIECASGKKSARIRVVALQAFSASACNEELQQNAMKLLRDHNEDSEIRIEAYLAAVDCPNGHIANQLAEIINKEKVTQVGGFITSHLKAVRDSTDFTKESMKHHLGNIRITKKFPIDPRRFSFNSEFSYAVDTLGLGAAVDYSVIYSQKGFLPRSLRLNMTNEAFGTSFNTIELSVRQENVENVLEHFFGPKGFFSQEPQQILNQVNKYVAADHVGRAKRNIKADSNNMATQYKTYGSTDTKFMNDINLDFTMKVFGSELAFLSLGNNIPSNSDELSVVLKKMLSDFKNGIKHFEKKWEFHSLLHDVELAYPTAVGLPLEVAIKSSTTGKLDFGIEVDLDNVLENFKNSKYRLKLIPSQDINFETFLRIDAGVLATGLRTSSNLHSADGGDITIDMVNDDKGFNIDLKLPRQNVELIEFKHNIDFFVSEQNRELKVLPFTQNKKRKTYQPVCFDQLQMFGLTVCYTANLPLDPDLNAISTGANAAGGQEKLPFLFNGPMQLSLILHTEKHIQLQGRHKTNGEFETWHLMFDTPGSSDSHKTELQLKVGVSPKLFARIDFVNPQKNLAGEAGVINNEKEFVLYGQFEVDSDKNLQKIGFTKNGKEYRPLIQMVHGNQIRNDLAGYKADGRVMVENGKDINKYKFDNLRIIAPDNSETIINGWLDFDHYKGFENELKIKRSEKNYKLVSHIKREHQMSMSIGAFVTENDNADTTVGGSLMLDFSKPYYKHELKVQTGKHALQFLSEVEKDGENENMKHKFINTLEVKTNKERSPLLASKVNGEVSNKEVHLNIEASKEDKIVSINFKMSRNQKTAGDFDLEIKSKLNRHFIDIKSKIDIQQAKYVLDNTLVTSWGTQGTCKGEVNQNIAPQNANVDLQGTFKLNQNDKDHSFNLKYTDVTDKMNSEFKLKRDNVELITYNGEVATVAEKQSGNFKLIVKDNLNLNGKFNLNKNGRGDYSGLIHLKKVGKPVKINGKFLYALPKFNFDTTIVMDDKKIFYKTENEFVKTKFSTKNNLEIDSEKIQLDASSKTTADGHLQFDMLVKLPNERKLTANYKRQMNVKVGKFEATMNLVDSQPDGKSRSLNFHSTGTEVDRRKRHFNINSELEYSDLTEKKIKLKLNGKHLPKASDSHQLILDLEILGAYLPDRIKFELNVNEYSKTHAVYHVMSSYGKKLSTNLNGNYHIEDFETNHVCKYELQAELQAPDTELKTFSIKTTGKYHTDMVKVGDDIDDINSSLDFNWIMKLGDKQVTYLINKSGSNKHGTYTIECSCSDLGSNKISGSWQRDLKHNVEKNCIESGSMNYQTQFDLQHFGNGEVKMNLDFVTDDQFNMHYMISSSNAKMSKFEILMKTKRSPKDNTVATDLTIQLNNDKYGMRSVVYTGFAKTGVEVKLQVPNHPEIIFIGIFEKLEDHHVKGHIQVEKIADLDLNTILELRFKSADDFYMLGDLHSDKLKINHVKAEIYAQNKTVTVNVNSADTKLLSGNAQYNVKKEKNKIIVEGLGDLMYKNEKNVASFKLIQQLFDGEHNQEIGFEYSFNGELGRKNVVSTVKVTNKNFIVKLTGCEESKQCTNFEIQSVLAMSTDNLANGEHEVMILIDLREMGYPYEFELQSKSSKLGFNVKHEIEATVTSNKNKKYKFFANVKPQNKLIQFEFPKRTVVLEIVNALPEHGLFGKYKNAIIFHWNKKFNPEDKGELSLVADLTVIKNQKFNGMFEMKLENPFLQRPLWIKGEATADRQSKIANANIIFNIFKTEEQKIVGEAKAFSEKDDKKFTYSAVSSFYSTGLNFAYKAKALAEFNLNDNEVHLESWAEGSGDMKFLSKLTGKKDKFEVQVFGFNQQLFNMKGSVDTVKQVFKTESSYQVIASKPVKLITEFSPTKYKTVLKRDGLLTAIAELNVGKEARLQLNKGDNTQIYNAKLSLEPSTFLTTTYNVNKEELDSFMKLAEEEFKQDTDIAKVKLNDKYQKVSQIAQDRIKKAKDSLPEVNKLINNYKNNVHSIVQELEEDPSLKKLFTELRASYEKIVSFIEDFLAKSAELYKKVQVAFEEFYHKQQQLFNETILPALKDLSKKIDEILNEFYKEFLKIVQEVFERAQKTFQTFENDLKELSKPIVELLKPFIDVIQDLAKTVAKEWTEFWTDLKVFLDKMPNLLKDLSNRFTEQLNKLRNVEELLGIVRDVFQHLETYTGSEEGREFLKKLFNYIEAKLMNKNVNDMEELEGLYYSLVQALNSLAIQLTGDSSGGKMPGASFFTTFGQPITLSLETLVKVPAWLSFKWSPFNYLRNEPMNSLSDLLIYNLPGTLNFLPPYQLNGHIADGRHIFTFDGHYMSFPGSCNYILAQDSVDNNFTVIAKLQNGKMQSVSLIDKSNYVTVDNKAQVQLNGKKAEYPIHEADMHAWRRYYTVSILSEYGVMVICTVDLRVCHVQVNGFYTGKLRGLFGNGNAEPYDDYMKPNGEIIENSSDFVNAYGLTKNCPPAQATDPVTNTNEKICNELFDMDSTLLFGYLFIDRKPYRNACNTAVHLNANNPDLQHDAACNIALTYASAAISNNDLPVAVPSQCVKCKVSSNKFLNVGEELQTKVPNSKADIVIVVDTTANDQSILNQLVQPVLSGLRQQLKARNLHDVHIAVIGSDGKQKYPNLLTTNGQLNYNGKLSESTLSGPKYEDLSTIGLEKVNEILEKLKDIPKPSGSNIRATKLAIDYPFRPDAAKSILLIRDDENRSKLVDFIGGPALNFLFKVQGVSVNYIGPVDSLTVDDKPSDKVVGFNKRVIAFLNGLKKQKIDHSPDPLIDVLLADDSWIFSVNNFKQLKSPEQKNSYVLQVSSMLADQLYKTEISSSCLCSLKYGLHGETTCAKTSYEYIPTKKNVQQKQG